MRSTYKSVLKQSPLRKSQDSGRKNPVKFNLRSSPDTKTECRQSHMLSPPSTARSHKADAEYWSRSININLKKG